MAKSISKNLIYNLIFQMVTLVLPLITVPYVSRVLGATGVGTYSYTLSISGYFVLFGTLGLSMYGNIQIAYTRDDKEKMSKTFWSILTLRIISAGIAAIVYIVIFTQAHSYQEVFMIQAGHIIAAMLDISWLFMGLEDFKKTVSRSVAVKLLGVCLIFLLVKAQKDLLLYVWINVLIIILGNVIIWAYLPRMVKLTKISLKDVFAHFVPSFQLFIPQIAIQIYIVLDKTMIGLLSNVNEVGYYEQSDKIVKAVLGLVTALGTVMLPRMSNLFANGNNDQMKKYLNSSLIGVAYVSIPLAFGLIGISNEFVPYFFGSGFNPVTGIMTIISPILFFVAMSNVMGMQFLLPAKRTKEFTISVIAGAVVDFILNYLFIPKFFAIGACIGTIVAEFVVMALQYYYLRKEIEITAFLRGILKYSTAAAAMLIMVRILGHFLGVSILTTLLQMAAGAAVYVLLLLCMREKVNLLILKKVRSVLKR